MYCLEVNLYFAGEYVAPRPGPILEAETNVQLGQHDGLWTYTIGQGARLPGLASKLFVAGKDRRKNAIYVALPELVQPSLSLAPLRFLFFFFFFFLSSRLLYLLSDLHCSQSPSIIHYEYHIK